MYRIILVICITSCINWGVFGQECSECCMKEDVDSYMGCYRQCSEQCQTDSCPSGGTRFGNMGQESYWTFTPAEWNFLTVSTINVNTYKISLDILTTASSGVIFFGNSPPSTSLSIKDDYIGAYMWQGHVYYGSVIHSKHGRVELMSDGPVNDGNYHTVVFFQQGDFIELCVDGSCKDDISGRGNRGFRIRLDGTIYMGAVPPSLKPRAADRLDRPVQGFNGCINNIIVDDTPSPPPNIKVNTD